MKGEDAVLFTQLICRLQTVSIIMSVLSPWIMIPWIQFTGQQLAVMRRNRQFGWFGLRSERSGPSRLGGTCALSDLDFQREVFTCVPRDTTTMEH